MLCVYAECRFYTVLCNIFVGHEFAFVAFLFCLFKIGACDENDLAAVGCKVFPKYIFFIYYIINNIYLIGLILLCLLQSL